MRPQSFNIEWVRIIEKSICPNCSCQIKYCLFPYYNAIVSMDAEQNQENQQMEEEYVQYFDAGTNIPTLRQYKKEFIEAIEDMENTLNRLRVPSLEGDEDFDNTKMGIKKVMGQIPCEEELTQIGSQALKHKLDDRIKNYKGGYKVLQKAKYNANNLKRQQQKIYYIASKIDLPPISPEFKETEPANLFGLSSFKEVFINKKNKARMVEKNTICKQYPSNISQTEFANNQDIIGGELSQDYIHQTDLLISISFNDSHNNEKQYEFLCIEENTIEQLVSGFDCMISQLHSAHYANGKANMEDLCKYLIMGDCIYYQGRRAEVEKIAEKAACFEKVNYRLSPMESVQMADLRVIFGHPYMYRHLGGCDHIVIFRQARIFMRNDEYQMDVIEKELYPLTIFESKMKKKKCEGCQSQFASVVSCSDPLKNGQNIFLCNDCHLDLHSTATNDLKETTAKIIPYIHD